MDKRVSQVERTCSSNKQLCYVMRWSELARYLSRPTVGEAKDKNGARSPTLHSPTSGRRQRWSALSNVFGTDGHPESPGNLQASLVAKKTRSAEMGFRTERGLA